jgi:hypothetical protein
MTGEKDLEGNGRGIMEEGGKKGNLIHGSRCPGRDLNTSPTEYSSERYHCINLLRRGELGLLSSRM